MTDSKMCDREYSIEVYRLFREKVTHEDNLVHQRTIWFVTLQALLFTSFAILLGDGEAGNGSALDLNAVALRRIAIVMSAVGILSALVTFASVSAAFLAIDKAQADWEKLVKGHIVKFSDVFPGVVGIGKLSMVHAFGKFAAWVFPGLVAIAWLSIASEIFDETLFRCT